jgi:hypothetical protein
MHISKDKFSPHLSLSAYHRLADGRIWYSSVIAWLDQAIQFVIASHLSDGVAI